MPGPERTISTETIVRTALDQLADGGVATVSMRSVAARLDLTANALYTYIATKQELLSLMTDAVIGTTVDTPVTGSPRERIVARIHLIIDAVRETPHSEQLLAVAPLTGPAALEFGELLLADFTDAGMAPVDAARASYAVQVQALGHLLLAATGPQERERLRDDAPELTARTWSIVTTYDSPEQWDWALERLLDGLLGPRAA